MFCINISYWYWKNVNNYYSLCLDHILLCMEKIPTPKSISQYIPRFRTLCKIGATTLALASAFSYAKMAHQRTQENTQQEIEQLFASTNDSQQDTISMLNTALQRHPAMWIQSKLYFDERVWQLHNALGRPGVDHYTNSTLRSFFPFVWINHYDALGKTCYIPDSTIMQWLTEVPHAYQHQQEGIVNLTLDMCIWTLRSWLHGSFYNKSYELPNSLEYHAHHQVEPAFLSAIFSHQYGVTLINDLQAAPHEEQGQLFLQYCNKLTIYWASDVKLILKTDAGKLLLEWVHTHDGWYKIMDAISLVSSEYKAYRSTFLFTYLKLDKVQSNQLALLLFGDPAYWIHWNEWLEKAFNTNIVLNRTTAWSLYAAQVQYALLACHNSPLLQAHIFDMFYQHVCTYAPVEHFPIADIVPFILMSDKYQTQLEDIYRKAFAEKKWKWYDRHFVFSPLLPTSMRTSQ